MAITYCLVCNITGEKYYGSSKRTLQKRLSKHKSKDNTCCSKQIILRGDYDIFQLAEYDTIEEAVMKEKWYIDNKECINKYRVKLTDEERTQYNIKKRKEYYQENTDDILEKRKEYYQEKKEKILERMKEKSECEFCKYIGRKGDMKKHQKSKKCLKYQ